MYVCACDIYIHIYDIYIYMHTDISNLKRFEQIELQAKLINYFLGSNKSNINQYIHIFGIARCQIFSMIGAEG